MTIRTSQTEIRDLLKAAEHAKSGRVTYPARTFDGDLLESVARDLHDHHELETRLSSALAFAAQDGDTRTAELLRWIQNGDGEEDEPKRPA